MTSKSASDLDRQAPKLPAGAAGILPTIWAAFIITIALALLFTFGNVWDLGRRLGIASVVAPLIGPTVDITAVGLFVVVPWLVLAGVPATRLRPANRLMALAGTLTLVLNSAPSAIRGGVSGDPLAWCRAGVEAIVPILLIAWSHVGPKLIGLFMEARTLHEERVATIRRASEEASTEASTVRLTEIKDAVDAALHGASMERDRILAEVAAERARLEADAQLVEERHRASMEAAKLELAQVKGALDALKGATKPVRKTPPRTATTKPVDDSTRTPRKTGEELLDERVEAAKDALPTWPLETPSGPEIASALGLKSQDTISKIRGRLEADRQAMSEAFE